MFFSKQLVSFSFILLLAQGSFVQSSIKKGALNSSVKLPALSPDFLAGEQMVNEVLTRLIDGIKRQGFFCLLDLYQFLSKKDDYGIRYTSDFHKGLKSKLHALDTDAMVQKHALHEDKTHHALFLGIYYLFCELDAHFDNSRYERNMPDFVQKAFIKALKEVYGENKYGLIDIHMTKNGVAGLYELCEALKDQKNSQK
jgi:hypothetical protein